MQPKEVLMSVFPKLVPFFKCVVIFFILFDYVEKNSFFYCVIKVAPILSLIAFVLMYGMNLSDYYAYSRRICIGLAFSSLGDAFLVFEGFFECGMVAFGIAQLSYVTAFGFHPLNLRAGAVIALGGACIYVLLFPGLSGIVTYATFVYLSLISLMLWRSVARLQLFDREWTWNKLVCCAGAVSFVLSDMLLGLHLFMFSIPYPVPAVMITYYAAQLCIALSIVDSGKLEKSQRQRSSKNYESHLLVLNLADSVFDGVRENEDDLPAKYVASSSKSSTVNVD